MRKYGFEIKSSGCSGGYHKPSASFDLFPPAEMTSLECGFSLDGKAALGLVRPPSRRPGMAWAKKSKTLPVEPITSAILVASKNNPCLYFTHTNS